jgi:hypothetical protein
MDKAQRRRLMATLLASAIADGQLDSASVDLAGLLFGDPDLWTDFQEHGAIVEDVIATSPSPVALTHDRLVGKALPTAMKLIEDDVVGALEIHDAQSRNGAGKAGDDTEYRRLRAKLKNYTRYLAERSDYERLNRSLRDTYARPLMGQTKPADLAKEFSLPLTDVALCLDEVQALLAILSAPPGVDPQSFVPTTKNGTARRKLVLFDTAGRPRWGRRKGGGARPVAKDPPPKMSMSPIVQAAPSRRMPTAPSAKSNARLPTRSDAAILQARLGLELDTEEAAALPAGWETATLPVAHIIQLLPYPRPRRLDTALSAFGYPSLQECLKAEPALIAILEEQAAAKRSRLLHTANQGVPEPLITRRPIGHRWWRAVQFYVECQCVSVGDNSDDRWPEPWEYISAARPDIYSEAGREGVRELLATFEIAQALHERPADDWHRIIDRLAARGDVHEKLALNARKFSEFNRMFKSLTDLWLERWQFLPVQELHGFREQEEAPRSSET